MTDYTNNIDDNVDDEIFDCLDLKKPKSFFLFAGAGSGKTRSLVEILKRIRTKNGDFLRLNRQKVAIITYTNAACDEIKERSFNDKIFFIHTIHSFAWELIKRYHQDIKKWIAINLKTEISDLEKLLGKGRPGTKTALERQSKIERKTARLNNLKNIRQFIYNPNGDNLTKDSLNHTEVIKICSSFLMEKPLMQEILIRKFPILLIDESQDTNKGLLEAFFKVQAQHKNKFSLGLFGDTMQRIYTDGKKKLGIDLPKDWVKPVKKLNHRCPKRIVKLINKVRKDVDGQTQWPRTEKEEGYVRLFIASSTATDKKGIEREIAKKMSVLTKDNLWSVDEDNIKILTLEHHMAASRMGFLGLFQPLYKISSFKTGLIDGTLSTLRFFTQIILPLVVANENNNEFEIAKVVKKHSPFFDKQQLKKNQDQLKIVKKADDAVKELLLLWKDNNSPKIYEILKNISKTNLFLIPESLQKIQEFWDFETEGEKVNAWKEALNTPFIQIRYYNNYISDKTRFGTHQGVKGLQFPRVMVILDDTEANGFLFSYEKLFNAKEQSTTDLRNKKEGKETGLERTKRLFYVTCSRAEKSLALVAYSTKPELIKKYVLEQEWFFEDEIEIL